MIYLSPPELRGEEIQIFKEILSENELVAGRYLGLFEESVAKYAGVKNALALSSGSAALHLAVRLSGVKTGDVVLASNFTFIGSVTGVIYEGGKLVFIDCDETLNVDLILLEKAIKKYKPKAFILTYLYGNCTNMSKIVKLCKDNGVILIEDAAEALGSFYEGKSAGSFGDFGIFSFNGNKIITSAGGGILLAKDENMLKKARFLANQAKEEADFYEHFTYGYNYRLANLNASLAYLGLKDIEKKVKKKREIFSFYKDALEESFDFIDEIQGARDNKWLSIALLKNAKNNEKINKKIIKAIKALKDENIEARHLWKPMSMQKLFAKNEALINKKSEIYFKNGLCLPSGTSLNKEYLEKICEILLKSVKS